LPDSGHGLDRAQLATAGAELAGVGDRGGQGRGPEQANARHGGDASGQSTGAIPGHQLVLEPTDLVLHRQRLCGQSGPDVTVLQAGDAADAEAGLPL
jgi:hypothetical protein